MKRPIYLIGKRKDCSTTQTKYSYFKYRETSDLASERANRKAKRNPKERKMINAKDELLLALANANQSLKDVVAFNIYYESFKEDKSLKGTTLVLSSLDFEYDEGYGSQHLYGTILFKDSTWLSRWEYDGSEGWEYNKPPTVDDILQ